MIDTDALIDAVDGMLHSIPIGLLPVDANEWHKWATRLHDIVYADGKVGPAEARDRIRQKRHAAD